MGDDRYFKLPCLHHGYSQADTVNSDGTLFYNAAHNTRLSSNPVADGIAFLSNLPNRTCAVNMPRNNMPAEPPVCRHSAFQVNSALGF